MIKDPNRVYDGFDNLIGGADAGRLPNLIGKGEREQAQSLENVVCRGGAPTNRPGFLDLPLIFDNPDLTYNSVGTKIADTVGLNQSVTYFKQLTFQGASYYAPRPGEESIMVSVAGRYYRITPGERNAHVFEVGLTKRNRANIALSYHLQAGTFHIVQDGESLPIIFDGATARRAGTDEIPTGKMMGYGMGRIVLVSADNLIYFGDIYDGKGNGDKDLLGFTETLFLNEGFASALPSDFGHPVAITFIPQQDSATGVGECLVFGEQGVASFFLSIPRASWKDSQFQREALRNIGGTGHRNFAEINNDIWFRSKDGWRSYRQAKAEVDKWAQIPMSTEVRQYIDADTASLLVFGSAIQFDNRLITTCTPQPGDGKVVVLTNMLTDRPYHNGLLALDFDILSSFGRTTDPAWDGHWSERTANPLVGLKVLQLVTGKFKGRERAFAFVINASGDNALMELTKDAVRDTGGPIRSVVTARSMDFNSRFNEKVLYGGDVWVDSVLESAAVNVTYRPDQFPEFSPWHNFSVEPSGGEPGEITPGGVPTLAKGYSPRESLPKPANDSDPVTKRILRRGFEFQAKLDWTGKATMRKFRMHAQEPIEDSKAKIP